MNIKRERERKHRQDVAIHKSAIRAEAKALKVWEKSKEDYKRQLSYFGTRRHSEGEIDSGAEDQNWASISHEAAMSWTDFCARSYSQNNKEEETTNG